MDLRLLRGLLSSWLTQNSSDNAHTSIQSTRKGSMMCAVLQNGPKCQSHWRQAAFLFGFWYCF